MRRLLPWVIVALFVALSVGSALSESLTFDEIVHAQEGISALTRHTFLVDTNNPPLVREFAMLPVVLGIRLKSPVPAIQLFPARVMIILLGTALLIAVYLTTKKYFGRTQALLAMFLLALEPTFLANSHYVTLDTGLTLFFFLSYSAFLRLMEKYSLENLMVTGITFGAAVSSKILALPFFLVSAVIVGLSVFQKEFKKITLSLPRMFIFAVVSVLVVWATYFFVRDVVIVHREDAGRLSSRLQTYAADHNNTFLQNSLILLETKKIPLGNYLAVLKNTLVRSQQPQKIFFLGSFYSHGRWYFLPVNLFYKEPLALWILFGLGFVAGCTAYNRKKHTALFAVPFFVILAICSTANIQPWVRYAEPAMPFLVIIASQSILLLFTRFQKTLFVLLCVWLACSVNLSFPHFISYANELAGPADTRYSKFMDSNLDWGQGLADVASLIALTKPSHVQLSYFGRDDGAPYALVSTTPYGSYKYDEICAFHAVDLPYEGKSETIISVSNWYYCGYSKDPKFTKMNVRCVIGNAALVFYE